MENQQEKHVFSLTGICKSDIINIMKSVKNKYLFDIETRCFYV